METSKPSLATADSDPQMAPELKAFYADRRLMWRNITWVALFNVGMNASLGLVGPLMLLRMNSPAVGMGEGMIASVSSVNSFLISFLVMYFAWKSDHMVSRWGRRVPFIGIAIPPIVLTILLFSFTENKWIIFAFWVVQIVCMDVLSSTISLLPIDVTPKRLLARAGSLQAMAIGFVAFLVLRYGMRLADFSEKLPFLISGAVLAVTSLLAALFIREPPIRQPTTERFKPWSALKVGFQDRRTIVLMVGVAMINSFTVMYNMWIWLYAKNVLNLTRTDMGAALAWAPLLGLAVAFPCAWLIDRFNPYRLLAVYLLLVFLTGVVMNSVHNAMGLAVVSIFWTAVTGLGGAAMMIVMRKAPRNAVGSFTASAAFMNNFYNGTIVFVSGWIIEHTGRNYPLVFFLGAGLSAVGFVILCSYGWLTRNDPAPELLSEGAAQ